MSIEVHGIPNWAIGLHWEKLAKILQPVLDRPEVYNTPEDIRSFLINGNMQAWHIDWETVFVTMVQPYGVDPQHPHTKVCNIVYCAGSGLDRWVEAIDRHFSAWARSMGCKQLLINGRSGWARIGAAHGWRQATTTIVRDV